MGQAGSTGAKPKFDFKKFAENFPKQEQTQQQQPALAAPQFNVEDIRNYISANKVNKRPLDSSLIKR